MVQAHYGAEELGCTVIPVSGGMTERQVNLIRDFEPPDYRMRCASCVRDFTSSFRNALRRWYSTVLGLMKS